MVESSQESGDPLELDHAEFQKRRMPNLKRTIRQAASNSTDDSNTLELQRSIQRDASEGNDMSIHSSDSFNGDDSDTGSDNDDSGK